MAELSLEALHQRGLYFLDVYNIFVDYFGENRVDIQNADNQPITNLSIESLFSSDTYHIIVHFPKVRVTNEHDRFVDIYDLYARTSIYGSGKLQGRFNLIRSTFPVEQAMASYTHSHVSPSDFGKWAFPCTGSGPINRTIDTLQHGYNEPIWSLYCRELDEYTKVESLSGGPYMRLEEMGQRGSVIDTDNLDRLDSEHFYSFTDCVNDDFSITVKADAKRITKLLLQEPSLKFNYTNNQYNIALSGTDFILLITKVFIDHPEELGGINSRELKSFFHEAIYAQGKLYAKDYSRQSVTSLMSSTTPLLTFKGEDIFFKLLGDLPSTATEFIPLLEIKYVKRLHRYITKLVNCLYGTNKSIIQKCRVI